MFFNVSGTFDTLNEPVLKIYEAKFEIWKCTWKGSAPCSYLSPALPFPVSRTRNHFTEGTFVKLEWTLPHFLLVFCRSLHCIIHIGNIHPERRIITLKVQQQLIELWDKHLLMKAPHSSILVLTTIIPPRLSLGTVPTFLTMVDCQRDSRYHKSLFKGLHLTDQERWAQPWRAWASNK